MPHDTTVTTVTTGFNKYINNKYINKPTVTTVTIADENRGEQFHETDQLFDQLQDLVNHQFRRWYCHHFHRLGRERVFILAAQARADGFNKRKLFSYLLKIST